MPLIRGGRTRFGFSPSLIPLYSTHSNECVPGAALSPHSFLRFVAEPLLFIAHRRYLHERSGDAPSKASTRRT